MKISNNGLAIIKKYEGCKLTAYKCPAGVWTVGYGHTGGVKQEDKITQAQAESYLLADLKRFEDKVNKYTSAYNWTQNEFDALVSFCYNIGNIDGLTDHGKRSKDVIAEKMLLYCKASGVTLNGLKNRRKEEYELFTKNTSTNVKNGGIMEYSLAKDGNKAVSNNFKVKEFRCKDGSDKILVDVDFVRDKLQKIRDHFGVPVTINSAYRTESYNKKVGGASKSYHMTGQAFDIVVKGKIPSEVARYAQSIGIKGIIQYNTFVHVDSRSTKYWARNNNGKVSVVTSF